MHPNPITFTDKSFQELSLPEWYGISSLRQQVFVVEQNCPYLDADGKDQGAHHIVGQDGDKSILAYARIVHPKDQIVSTHKLDHLADNKLSIINKICTRTESGFRIPAIGRVVLDKSKRGTGLSHILMTYTIQSARRIYGNHPFFLSAQTPLHDFYIRHGFIQSGPGYLEDDIPHIPMVRVVDL